MKAETQEKNNVWQIGCAWAVVALFFSYQYVLRMSSGWLVHELRPEFHLTAEQFAQVGAYTMYAYALLQIPVGFIMDKIGVKKTVLGSLCICLVGTYLFTTATTFESVKLSRFLVGAGSACAFMGALKIVADSMPFKIRGYFLGATLAVGTLGPLLVLKPFMWYVDQFGWRKVLQVITLLGVVLMLAIYFILPKSAKANLSHRGGFKSFLNNFLSIVKDWRIMLYAFLAIGLYTPLSALADLWGTSFFGTKYMFSTLDAALSGTMMYVGLAIGSVILPGLCVKEVQFNRAIQICLIGFLVLFSIVLYGPVVDRFQLMLLLVVMGFFCGAEMMCFSGATLYSTPANSGLTLGVVNTLNMLAGAILEQMIGVGLDFQWDGAYGQENLRIYSTEQYVTALSMLIAVIGLCAIASLFLKQRRQPNRASSL